MEFKRSNGIVLKIIKCTSFNRSFPHIDTDVDFDNYIVIAVFDEQKTYTGYSIEIIKVEESGNCIIIGIEYLDKGGINPALSRPFHVGKIPKTGKHIIFKEIVKS